MNQDNNNLNQNNLNTQGNNVIPNNAPLNNQNMNINQQTINPQPQATPSIQQPINNFENGNVDNGSFNCNPTKKMNIGLIFGIVVAVAVVILAIVFGSKFLFDRGNDVSARNITNEENKDKNVSFDELKKANENLHITNYVDYELGYSFQYPINIDLTDSYVGRGRNNSAAVYRKETIDDLNSFFGNESIKIIRMDLIEDLENKTQDEVLNIIALRYLGISDKVNLKNNFSNNGIKWSKYQFNKDGKNDNYLFIANYNGQKFAISFFDNANGTLNEISNKSDVFDSIIKTVKFSNKDDLLKIKEASVLMYNSIYELEICLIYDELGKEQISSAFIPKTIYTISGAGVIAYKKTSDVNINNAINKLTTQKFSHRLLDVENYTYTVKSDENEISLNDKKIGDIQVKFYQLDRYDKVYQTTSSLLVYVFVTDEYYGIVSNLSTKENDVFKRARLDYAMKNILFNNGDIKDLYTPSDYFD